MTTTSTKKKIVKTTSDIPPSFTKALGIIKRKGFTHIKVELEAKLGRQGHNEDPCTTCNGGGWLGCSRCSKRGWLNQADKFHKDLSHIIECKDCEGDGELECGQCNGRGFTRGGATPEWCQAWLEGALPKEIMKAVVFGRFYDDGSVDSEYTFTLPISKAYMVIDVMKAFKRLGNVIGNGLSETNAGMHISVLPSGTYPCDSGLLNAEYMKNFKHEVSKLLPALYFVAGHTKNTRSLEYRQPFVSDGHKYSAIYTHGDTAIEYRIFDPCFGKPEVFYEKVEIIAATLKYYSLEKVEPKYKAFSVFGKSGLSFENWFGTMDNHDALLKTIKVVKPDKSFVKLKAERSYEVTKKQLKDKYKPKEATLKAKYEEQKTETLEACYRVRRDCVRKIKEFIVQNPMRARDWNPLVRWMADREVTLEDLYSSNELIEEYVIAHPNDFYGTEQKEFPDYRTWRVKHLKYLSQGQRSAAWTITPGAPLDAEFEED